MDSSTWIEWTPSGHGLSGAVEYNGWRQGVAMEFSPALHGDTDEWRRLREIWLDLPAHAALLDASALRAVIAQCTAENPRKRHRSLADLRNAWRDCGAIDAVRADRALEAWQLAEDGYGWLILGNPAKALAIFDDALRVDAKCELAQSGQKHAQAMIATAANVEAHRPRPVPPLEWVEAKPEGETREQARSFEFALEIYRRVRLDGIHDAAIYTAIARCQLALRLPGIALDFAQRALAVDGRHHEALSIRSRSYLLYNRPADALKTADVWISAYPSDAAAHYARGRALFALSRFVDARDAFDRACTLKPDMAEALLLRREADRAARRVRDEVGTQPALELDVPEHLRGALASGNVHDMLRALERPEYDADPIAKRLHAQCLAFDKRFDEALAMFERAAALSSEHAHEAEVGKGHVLLALTRADEALDVFARVLADKPSDLDALEGHALALRALGRDAEAEEELKRVVAASGGRSELRVGRGH